MTENRKDNNLICYKTHV